MVFKPDAENLAFFNDFLQSGFILSQDSQWVWLGWGKVERCSSFTPHRSQFFGPDFFLTDPLPYWKPAFVEKVSQTGLLQKLAEFSVQDEKPNWEPPSYQEFEKSFLELKTMFSQGILQKAVPVVFERTKLEVSVSKRASWLRYVLEYAQKASVWVYGLWDENQGILGATPEILFRQTKQTVETAALAGTYPRSGGKYPSLLEDPKERHEHQLVVEGISNSLKDLGKIQVGKTQELILPRLIHLFTPIELQGSTLFSDVVQRLHPTPALGAFPKEAGKAWLAKNQPNRNRFGAPFGLIIDRSNSICVVAIRNLQWSGDQVLLGAGCGIVPESDLLSEWNEIRAKIQSVKDIFYL